ncbi:MAG TPA: hypothetical protein VHN79_06025 [Lacunisphaera sp.]|nr:hypothetical protein [Lacunisphaera sp.]
MKDQPCIVWHEGFPAQLVLVKRSSACWKGVPPEGVFLREDRQVTVFPNRTAARQAIERSIKYHAALDGADRKPDGLCVRELYHIAAVCPA